MDKTPLTGKIERIIAPTAESMGYEIVRILQVGIGSGNATLQIMAEKPDGTMDVEDCSRLSQAVSALLDVEDVIEEAYHLEISSPGIDRPLTREKDFDRYKDNEARIELSNPIGTQKKFKGMLTGIKDGMISMETETGPVSLPFSDVSRAKLVLTDKLIRQHQEGEKKKMSKETQIRLAKLKQKTKKG